MSNKLKNMRTLLLILLAMVSLNVSAQTITLTGNVKDKSGDPIIGASIVEKGTTNGTITDFDGNFSLKVSGKDPIVVSYIGMKSQEINVKGGGKSISIFLEDDTQALDEVVVIGYGTAKKKDLTGSVSTINSAALKDIPVANIAEAMSGKMAGVQITTTEGSPDADVKIRVRGGGSITGDNTPLYIVDGFPVNSISDIPSSDIQDIVVLKDASSTAIYGARGANGVILITTKSPKEGKFSLSFNGSYGWKKLANKLDVLSPYQFAAAQYELAAMSDKVSDQYEPYFGKFQDMDIYNTVNGTDWLDEVFGRTGYTINNNISVTGGNDKVSYNLSYSRVDDKAIMTGSDYKRNSLSAKFNASPFKWLKLDFTARYSDTDVNGGGANDVKSEKSTNDSRLKHSVIYTPITMSNVTSDTDDEEEIGSLFPPLTMIRDTYRYKDNQIYSYNGGVTIKPIKGLSIRSELGYESRPGLENRYYGITTYYARQNSSYQNEPALSVAETYFNRFRNTNTINYEATFKKIHKLTVLIGEETMATRSRTATTQVDGMPLALSPEDSFKFTSSGKYTSYNNYTKPDVKLLSFFGRANYDLYGRYLLTATFRADGSSIFAPGQRWGYFPSVAVGWRISDEKFMQNTSEWLSNLKLRFSYGTAGNNNIDSDQYRSMYSVKNTAYLQQGTSYWTTGTQLYNPDLKWETTYTRNLGLDFGFWNNRLNGSVELYSNNTKDLLIDFPVNGTGYNTQARNIGETSNKGVELQLNGVIVDTKDWGLDLNFNISKNKGKVKSLGGLDQIIAGSTWSSKMSDDYRVYVGQEIGLMYGYVTEGRYSVDDFNRTDSKWELAGVVKDDAGNYVSGPADNSSIAGKSWGPGALKLKDLNEDGKIDANDRKIIGHAAPKFTGGFGINLRYKSFDLSTAFTFVYGNDIYNANKIEFTSNDNNYKYRNMTTEMALGSRWTNVDWATGDLITDKAALAATNANTSLWSPNSQYVTHSWAIEDGSFLRMNNLTVGYSLPKNIIAKVFLQQCRLYFTATNLFCLTNYSGFDPEVDTRTKTPLTPGVDYSAYPKSRTYNFGINLTF